MEQKLLTTTEVIETLRISRPTLLKLIKDGKLKAIKIGHNYRIKKKDLDKFINAGVEEDSHIVSKRTMRIIDKQRGLIECRVCRLPVSPMQGPKGWPSGWTKCPNGCAIMDTDLIDSEGYVVIKHRKSIAKTEEPKAAAK